mgnify:CR=1 FL=1
MAALWQARDDRYSELRSAQAQNSQSIYTCTDSKGRRITSDRPIVECLDREQQRLGRTGTVREVIPPSYTREEREKDKERQRRGG